MTRIKYTLFLSLAALNTGCNDNTAEQKEFIDHVKASSIPKVEPIPQLQEFKHHPYSSFERRSPFVAPEPAIIQNETLQVKDCLQPDPNRNRESLERYPIDNLLMQGTISTNSDKWALVQASDRTVYRITKGQYMGLFMVV
jgi:type IV pilus assembly protein PilP